MQDAKQAILNQLRQEVLLLEGYKPAHTGSCRIKGLEAVEAAFPNGVFPFGAIHELVDMTQEQATAGCGFVGGLLASLLQQGGICLWIGTALNIFPPGLKMFGIEPDRMIFIRLRSEREVLWAVEEALKCKGIAAVVGELQELSFAVSRRLQLAVETSQVTGFILVSTRPIPSFQYENRVFIKRLNGGGIHPVLWK